MYLNCGVGEDSWESLVCKEIKSVHPKGSQSWILTGRTDVEAEAPILWPPDGKSWLTGKDSDARENWGQEEKGVTEDGKAGWYHWLNEHEFKQSQGNIDGQRNLAFMGSVHGVTKSWTWLVTEQRQHIHQFFHPSKSKTKKKQRKKQKQRNH